MQLAAGAFMVFGIPSLVAAKNLPPTVEFQEPTPGQMVPLGTSLTMVVSTYDPDGYTHMAEFFADGKSLGAQVLDFLIPPAPGEIQQYLATWVASDPGVHVLSVVVMDDQGTTSGAELVPVIATRRPASRSPSRFSATAAPASGKSTASRTRAFA